MAKQMLNGFAPPHDLEAEESVLGAMMLDNSVIEECRRIVAPSDFYREAHERIFRVVTDLASEGSPADAITVSFELQRRKQLDDVGGGVNVANLVTQVPIASNAPYYARIVFKHARVRDLIDATTSTVQRVSAGATLPQAFAAATADFETIERRVIALEGTVRAPDPDLDDFLAASEAEYDWVVPALLERNDRIILTGQEGKGKSTLIRQLAVMTAAGIHPFTGIETSPMRVMLVDLENPEGLVRRELRKLRAKLHGRLKRGQMIPIARPAGIDITNDADLAWLTERFEANQPDFVCIGPLYKLYAGDQNEAEIASHVQGALDRLRTQARCAVLIEAHSPQQAAGSRRAERPSGSALWLRWPEFGVYLGDEGHIRHWRGPRDARDWPPALKRGGDWPWTVVDKPGEVLWARIAELVRRHHQTFSQRELAELLDVSQKTVSRCLIEHGTDWLSLQREIGATLESATEREES